jgi:mRNA-degrading endonuclease HigB of HigAB toxin-antitoxin module
MRPSDFIYKGTYQLLKEKYPNAKLTLVAKCAGVARDHFNKNGNFKKGSVFDDCYNVALSKFKILNKV